MNRSAEQATEIAFLRDRAARLEADLQAILTSSSWRLTRPMRGLVRALRAPRRLWRSPVPRPTAPPETAPPAEPVRHIAFDSIAPEHALPAKGLHKAVWVGVDLPYPVRDGRGHRVHRLLNWLGARGWSVLVLICPRAGQMPTPSRMREAAAAYPGLLVLDPDGHLHGHSPIDDALRELPANRADLAPEVLARVQEAFAPNAVFVEAALAAQILPALRPGAARAVDLGAVLPDGGKPLPDADLLITLAPVPVRMPDRLLAAVGADLPPTCPEYGGSVKRSRLLLVGSDHPDDVTGLRHFRRFAWPIIRRAAPEAELVIAGEVGAAAGKVGTGVRLLLGPPDRAYAEAGIVLSPAIAPGFRLEIAQALRHGRPVVCWPGALAGLPSELHPFCHVAANWVMFARHILRLLETADDDSAVVRVAAERAFAPDRVYAEIDAALARLPFVR